MSEGNLTTVTLRYYDKRDGYHQKSHCNDNREARNASVTNIRVKTRHTYIYAGGNVRMNTVPALKTSKDQVLGFTAAWSVLCRTLVTLYSMNLEPLPKLGKHSFVYCAGNRVPLYKKEKRISGVTTPGIVKPA